MCNYTNVYRVKKSDKKKHVAREPFIYDPRIVFNNFNFISQFLNLEHSFFCFQFIVIIFLQIKVRAYFNS